MKTLPEVMAEFVNLNKKMNTKRRPWTKPEMDNHVQRLNDWFATIQLDAMKEGARRAASVDVCDGSCNEPCPNKQKILTTANNWTENDLS